MQAPVHPAISLLLEKPPRVAGWLELELGSVGGNACAPTQLRSVRNLSYKVFLWVTYAVDLGVSQRKGCDWCEPGAPRCDPTEILCLQRLGFRMEIKQVAQQEPNTCALMLCNHFFPPTLGPECLWCVKKSGFSLQPYLNGLFFLLLGCLVVQGSWDGSTSDGNLCAGTG